MRKGEGLLAIWNDIVPGNEAAFRDWHSREHMAERLSLPGFRHARRLFSSDARPRWLTLYRVDSPAVLASPDYLARLNAPTDWTRRVLPSFTQTRRMACEIVCAAGRGRSGRVLSMRGGGAVDDAAALSELVEDAVGSGVAEAGYVGRAIAEVPQATAERGLRRNEAMPPAVAAFLELAGEEMPKGAGDQRFRADLYSLEHALTARD